MIQRALVALAFLGAGIGGVGSEATVTVTVLPGELTAVAADAGTRAVPIVRTEIATNMVPSTSVYSYVGGSPWPGWSRMPSGAEWQTRELRSGTAGSSGFWSPLQPINATVPQQYITRITFSYRYLLGFGPGVDPGDFPVLSLSLVDHPSDPAGAGHLVYTSPALDGPYTYSACSTPAETCYSPPIAVDIKGISVAQPVGTLLFLRFSVENNKCNLQIPISTATGIALVVYQGPQDAPDPDRPVTHGSGMSVSVGSTVVLVASGLVAVYLAAGCAINRHDGHSGLAALPNRRFWGGAGSLIAEGGRFTVTKCLGFRVKWSGGDYEHL